MTLLKMKHWQIFGLLIAIPLIIQFLFIGLLSTSDDPSLLFAISPILTLLFCMPFLGWLYAIANHLYEKLPNVVSLNLKRFKFFIFVFITYLCGMMILMALFFSDSLNGNRFNLGIFMMISALQLFAMFCIFYCLWFVAKALKAIELQKRVTFIDFAGEFFLIWFFPIGIWFIQPRLNKLVESLK